MNVDPLTLQSDDPDIFAGGDAVRGPQTVIEAIADGKQAAISIDRYIGTWIFDWIEKRITGHHEPSERKGGSRPPGLPCPALCPGSESGTSVRCKRGFRRTSPFRRRAGASPAAVAAYRPALITPITFDAISGKTRKCNLCYHRVVNGLYPACADNVCLAHCIYFGDPAEIEKTILKKRKVRGGWGEIIPKVLIRSRE